MRPMLLPALRGLWRDRRTWQLGIEPARAVQLADADPALVRLVLGLDGTRELAEVCASAAERGIDPDAFAGLVGQLGSAGAVVDATLRGLPDPASTERRRRLQGDALGLSLRMPDPERVLAARARLVVVVRGSDALCVPVAAQLAAAGVGRLHVRTHGAVGITDVVPGGAGVTDEHRPRATVAAEVLRRVAPTLDTRPVPERMVPHLVVLTDGLATDPRVLDQLTRAAVPHLLVGSREDRGLVGPLVVPGRTSCLRCADLHRTDRDPAWPLLLAQLAAEIPGSRPVELALTACLVALAAAQALQYLDSGRCDAIGGCLEVQLPGYPVRRRSYPPHHACCGAVRAVAG